MAHPPRRDIATMGSGVRIPSRPPVSCLPPGQREDSFRFCRAWPCHQRANRLRVRSPMQCPKCHRENPQEAQFCTRCHTPLRFTCPACRHVQDHGGKCDQCGVDFAKYAAMLLFQATEGAQVKRRRAQRKASIAWQIFLVPLTGGLSLLKYLLARFRRD